MDKNCGNCLHELVDEELAPCRYCTGYEKWQSVTTLDELTQLRQELAACQAERDGLRAEVERLQNEVVTHDHCWTHERHLVEVEDARRNGAESMRERAAKVCEGRATTMGSNQCQYAADAIRSLAAEEGA
jgi:hypothetical protein